MPPVGLVNMSGRLGTTRSHRKQSWPARAGVLALAGVACATTVAPGALGPSHGRPSSAGPDALSSVDSVWVEEMLAGLDLRERVAQMVMVWMSGGYASSTDEELTRIEKLVRESEIGGVVISLGTPLGYASRLNRLQEAARIPLLVAADFESGPGYRVGGVYALPSMLEMAGATSFPPAMAFGAADDEALAYEAGRITAVEALALGVHLTFAPVLDVNNNPENPIINTRSLGADPERVAALGGAYIRGAREAGLLTTAKHFPGHGDTGTDSHVALPQISGDRARLDRLELIPFRRAIAEGVDAVMTAHVAAPAILGAGAPPATLSPYFMTELLREDLGFEGVLFTDALDMAAIVDGYGAEEAAVRALEAGADVLLMPVDPARAIDAVVAAVGSGRVTPERVEDSVRRLLALKARAGLDQGGWVDADEIPRVVGIESHRSFADTVARRSITLVRDFARAIPIDSTRTRRVLSLTFARPGNLAAGRVFDRRLGETLEVRRARVGFETHASVYDSLARLAEGVDVVVVSAYVPPGTAADSVDLPEDIGPFTAAVEAHGAAVLMISFGSPYLLTAAPDVTTYLLAWGGGEASQRAAADALLGRSEITGRLPISLPPLHAIGEGLVRRTGAFPRPEASEVLATETSPADVGMDPAALARVDRIILEAIGTGATPGAALAVGRHGRLVRLRGYGRLDWAGSSAAVTDSSVYDLASLTKVVATTTAVMQLIDQGRLTLDTRIGEHLPEWSEGWKREVTVRELLLHRGGLPPFRPFWRDLEGREAYRSAIGALESDYAPGTGTVYSDIGLMTLAFVVETITAEPLDRFLDHALFEPLSLAETGFNPPPALRHRIAPTEVDTIFRGRHVVGEVHDENAHALGGVAGHAGLFSSARDLARFADWMLDAARVGRGLGERNRPAPAGGSDMARIDVPAPATVALFTARAAPSSSRALGWDTPSGRSSAGRFFGGGAFGHTGFTGTSLWVDPELDVFVVLLTNRVNPTRANQKHIALRRAVHDAVATSVRDMTVEPRP